ncbi:thioredoxin [Candidatus Pacearchaeota archaeon]|jgi:thioredoxin 1|nr:thioredoxin [Candidatus Pacearchaeota archaeon]|tara:strand:+ start:5600 stop:5929 length:330 start_codon:yes stop_codon:yes gene_type:complete
MVNKDKVTELSKSGFDKFIKDRNVLIDFFAEWCMPCLMMEPIIDELSEEFKGKIKFAKVNIDDNPELAGKFNVSSIPNFVLFKNGKQIEQFIGSMSSEEFEEKLNKFIK